MKFVNIANSLIIMAFISIQEINAKAVQGVNLGGWMVLEPWITPSLFYPFLNKKRGNVAFDSHSFCEVMENRGKELNDENYANKWMRAHWDAWYTEDHIKQLADRGVERVRLPIGDWTINQYNKYVGCMDGAAEKIEWMLETCFKYKIGVLIDVHTARDSQNGFDNSGLRQTTTWQDDEHFKYVAQPLWSSLYDPTTQQNGQLNYANIQWSIDQMEALLQRFGTHPALIGFQPVNEPWLSNDINLLADFYREVRKLVQRHAPQAYFVFHDSFRPGDQMWLKLFADGDWDKVAMDHHSYMAFWDYNETSNLPPEYFCSNYANDNTFLLNGIRDKMEVWMGEWAFATDNCAHWLIGFNDQPGRRQAQCAQVKCPEAYYQCPDGAPESDCKVNDAIEKNGPFGINEWDNNQTLIEKGMCWTDNMEMYPAENLQQIADCTVQFISDNFDASFMWTAHNEINKKWDYIKAYDAGWFRSINSQYTSTQEDYEEDLYEL